jgi:hypothetical protein
MGDEIKTIQHGTQNCLAKQFGYTTAIASNHMTEPGYIDAPTNHLVTTCGTIDTTDEINSSVTDLTTEPNSSILLCNHVDNATGHSPTIAGFHSIGINAKQSCCKGEAFHSETEIAIECDQLSNIKPETLPVATKATGTDAKNGVQGQSRSEASAETDCSTVAEAEHKEEKLSSLRNTSVQSDQDEILLVAMEQTDTPAIASGFHDDVAKTELNAPSDPSYDTPTCCTAVCGSSYPESVREVSALLQQARCSSPPHPTPQLAAVAASTSHSCGSLYAQCGANLHEPVSLNEILTEREHLPAYCRYRLDAIDCHLQCPLLEDEEALFRDYHKQQQRFLMGNGGSVGPCAATSSNTAATAGSLQSAENGQTQRASPTGAPPVFRISRPEDCDYLKGLVPQLRREAKDWEAKSDSLEAEVLELRRKLRIRDQEVMRLQREVHKLKASAIQYLVVFLCFVVIICNRLRSVGSGHYCLIRWLSVSFDCEIYDPKQNVDITLSLRDGLIHFCCC